MGATIGLSAICIGAKKPKMFVCLLILVPVGMFFRFLWMPGDLSVRTVHIWHQLQKAARDNGLLDKEVGIDVGPLFWVSRSHASSTCNDKESQAVQVELQGFESAR